MLPEDVYTVDVITSDAVGNHDVYAVQRIHEWNYEAFISATNSPDIGVVYLDQWGAASNGVTAHSEVTGEPVGLGEDWEIGSTVWFEVEKEHEIFANLPPGQYVQVHEGYWAEHSWFDETDFELVASVGAYDQNDYQTKGGAIAVDDATNTVLASSLGYSWYVNQEHYTSSANVVLGNTVQYVSWMLANGTPHESVGTISTVQPTQSNGGYLSYAG